MEVKGIRAQYVIFLAIGAVVAFASFFIASFLFGQWVALTVGVTVGVIALGGVWSLNAKFGEHGLLQWMAHRHLPVRLANNRRICKMLLSCK
ncbi:MAG: DUF4133 domain-containing protein [Paludibacteraceae bacterium]|nr:DUF4133 domain-containing protein [Paludibacteraceae bacterium]